MPLVYVSDNFREEISKFDDKQILRAQGLRRPLGFAIGHYWVSDNTTLLDLKNNSTL